MAIVAPSAENRQLESTACKSRLWRWMLYRAKAYLLGHFDHNDVTFRELLVKIRRRWPASSRDPLFAAELRRTFEREVAFLAQPMTPAQQARVEYLRRRYGLPTRKSRKAAGGLKS